MLTLQHLLYPGLDRSPEHDYTIVSHITYQGFKILWVGKYIRITIAWERKGGCLKMGMSKKSGYSKMEFHPGLCDLFSAHFMLGLLTWLKCEV